MAVSGFLTPSESPTVEKGLNLTGEVNDTVAPNQGPIHLLENNRTSVVPATTSLPPFLHPLLRNKREATGQSNPSLPVPPYVHPILRCKRGSDDEGCSSIFNPSKTAQAGASATRTEEEHDKDECHYHKLRKTNHETVERPVVSQVKGCEGALRRSVFMCFENIYF